MRENPRGANSAENAKSEKIREGNIARLAVAIPAKIEKRPRRCAYWWPQRRASPVAVNDPRLVLAKRLHGDQSLSIDDICRTLKISRSTYYRYVAN